MKISSVNTFDHISDPNTPEMLLPLGYAVSTNSDEIDYCKLALNTAITGYLLEEERDLLYKHYWQGKSKTAIAKEEGVVQSTISKRLSKIEGTLKARIEFALDVYKEQKKQDNLYS